MLSLETNTTCNQLLLARCAAGVNVNILTVLLRRDGDLQPYSEARVAEGFSLRRGPKLMEVQKLNLRRHVAQRMLMFYVNCLVWYGMV